MRLRQSISARSGGTPASSASARTWATTSSTRSGIAAGMPSRSFTAITCSRQRTRSAISATRSRSIRSMTSRSSGRFFGSNDINPAYPTTPRRSDPIRFRAPRMTQACPHGHTSIPHCRGRPQPDGYAHEPMPPAPSASAAQGSVPVPSFPLQPTIGPSVVVTNWPVAWPPRGWPSNPTYSSPPPLWLEPPRCLLDRLAQREQRLLVERTPDQLQRQRQALRILARRHRYARQARHVYRLRDDVVEVHFHRIGLALLAGADRRRRRRGREDGIHALGEHVLKVFLDQGADLLRAQIICVVITGREHIGADHDAAADFRAESCRASVLVHLGNGLAIDARTIAHAVITREVRGRLRGRHDIISRQRVFGVRQRNLDDLRAGRLQPFRALRP